MNKNLFKTNPGNVKDADATNEAGARAYALSDKAALAQYILTGTFNGTFYASDTDQLKKVLELVSKCPVGYVARLAVYARQEGLMKDTPALLTAYVASKDTDILKSIFPLVINDPKMLRNFVQIIRSGVVGRKSFGSAAKKLIQNYLNGMTDEQLFKADVGNNPSLQDIIKMTHPRAETNARNALYGYLIGKNYDAEALLPLAAQFEAFKKDMSLAIPNVPFQMLTSLPLSDDQWKQLAVNATWNQIRMNLNTFSRHNVFNDKEVVATIAGKLSNQNEVRRARVFPYQLFTTFVNIDNEIPMPIKLALQNAAETAMENIPSLEGDIYIALDVSGSMKSPVTGVRRNPRTGKEESFTSKMSCGQVAALFAAAILRKNSLARIIPFDTAVRRVDINPLDSVMTNAQKLALNGGGTDCGVVLARLNEETARGNTVIYVSDNQSWVQSTQARAKETPMAREWSKFKNRNPNAKLINIDIAPYGTVQIQDASSILNIGGFNDTIFDVVHNFLSGTGATLIERIENIDFNK